MNFEKIKSYIQSYKDHFELVNHHELYKWRAVKHFQDHWDIDAPDFHAMLSESMSLTFNLLDSSNYFPKRMIQRYALDHPELVRNYFKELYDEDKDIYQRIESFKTNLQLLNVNYDAISDYQDHRAIVVYLALKYPNRYYFYKQRMFKTFTERIEYDYQSIAGRIENINQYHYLCDIIKHELSQDQELIRLHTQRLTEDCYIDTDLNILTQDFIYAVVVHLPAIQNNAFEEVIAAQDLNIDTVSSDNIQVSISDISFTPSSTNHIQNNIENKRLGTLGELFVLEYEKDQLTRLNNQNLANRVSHDAVNIGDGLGYDVLSYDVLGNQKYIEVKTTKGDVNTVFYVTRTEMERSKKEKDNYYLYRVYNFDDKTLKGDIKIIRGDISGLCVDSVNFKVKMI